MSDAPRALIQVDLDAIRANLARLSEIAGGTPLLAVVKADGYGHGMLPVARAAREIGAPARVHLKVDSGLNRGGCAHADWPDLVAQARAAELSVFHDGSCR